MLTRRLIEIVTLHKDISSEEIEENVKIIDPIIRKFAHFSIYAIVGMAACSFVSTFNFKWKYRFLISFSTGLIYAITDEIHQGFIPGRSGEIRDVMIDTLGAIVGTVIIWCINTSINKKNNRI